MAKRQLRCLSAKGLHEDTIQDLVRVKGEKGNPPLVKCCQFTKCCTLIVRHSQLTVWWQHQQVTEMTTCARSTEFNVFGLKSSLPDVPLAVKGGVIKFKGGSLEAGCGIIKEYGHCDSRWWSCHE